MRETRHHESYLTLEICLTDPLLEDIPFPGGRGAKDNSKICGMGKTDIDCRVFHKILVPYSRRFVSTFIAKSLEITSKSFLYHFFEKWEPLLKAQQFLEMQNYVPKMLSDVSFVSD